jgi:hypothetical protein
MNRDDSTRRIKGVNGCRRDDPPGDRFSGARNDDLAEDESASATLSSGHAYLARLERRGRA